MGLMPDCVRETTHGRSNAFISLCPALLWTTCAIEFVL